MYLILNNSNDSFFNMAAEEYLLQNFESAIMLWRNHNTVVVGKNQNTLLEINLDYAKEHDISVVRRLTGGGTVFHDMGNINFTVIIPFKEGSFCDYSLFTNPICKFLKQLGVDASLSGRNDLLIDGMKFSGNAQTVKNHKMLHHGTLLFSTNVTSMAGVLNPNKKKLESKGIKSVVSRVTNIESHLKNSGMTAESFYQELGNFYEQTETDIERYTFTDQDIQAITKLAKEKYATWDWNFGESPSCTGKNSGKYNFGTVELVFEIIHGLFDKVYIYGDFFGMGDLTELTNVICGIPYDAECVSQALNNVDINSYIAGMTQEQFIELLFQED